MTWARAARSLARRVNRRSAWSAALRPVGVGLLASAVLALVRRLLIAPDVLSNVTVPVLLAAGLLVSLIAGIAAARRTPRTGIADAAWALDRLARAKERGLTAAVVEGPAASEAAWADPAVPPPPSVRLLPPTGLATTVAAILLATVAVLGPARSNAADDSPPAPIVGGTAQAAPDGHADAARTADAEASKADARATARDRVRRALGLSSDGHVDAAELAAKLQDPEIRARARAAADGDDGLAGALDHGHTSPEEIARALGGANDERARAIQQRRAAVLARGRAALPPIPPHRRDLVVRYFDLRRDATSKLDEPLMPSKGDK